MKVFTVICLFSYIFYSCQAQETRGAEDAKGLKVGSKAPTFTAIDADSTEFSLKPALQKGPVVLIFYRGFWCPVCNKHLSAIQDSLTMVSNKGATVIAVSPEKPEYLDKMAQKTAAQFRLLYDEGYKIANAYDVTFTPAAATRFMFNTVLNAKLKKTHSDDTERLPIPATYIINQNGVIIWRQFDPDYKNRSSVKDIIENLP